LSASLLNIARRSALGVEHHCFVGTLELDLHQSQCASWLTYSISRPRESTTSSPFVKTLPTRSWDRT